MAIAAMASWDLARCIGSKHPYFAPIAVVLTMQSTVEDSISLGGQRVLGIFLGIVMAELSQHVVGVRGWTIGLLVIVSTILARIFRLGRQIATQICVSGLLVWVVGVSSHSGYAVDRIQDTIVGVVVAVFCHMFILPPDYTSEACDAIHVAGLELALRFDATAEWVARGADPAGEVLVREQSEAYLSRLHEAWQELIHASHALRYSPLVRNRRDRLKEFETAYRQVREGYEHLTGMVRTIQAWRETGSWSAQDRTRLGQDLRGMAAVVRDWADRLLTPDAGRVARGDGVRALHASATAMMEYESALQNDIHQFQRLFMVE